jgi:hypothetical protein
MKKIFLYLILFLSINCGVQGQRVVGTFASAGGTPPVSNVQNLLLYSEQLDNAAWVKQTATVVANQVADVLGATTLDKVTVTSDYGYLQQSSISVSELTPYFIAFDIRNGNTVDGLAFGVLDQSNADANIIGQDYLASTNTSTPVRLTFNFTTPAGCTLLKIRMAGGLATEYYYLGSLQIAQIGKSYVITTSTIVP